MWLLQQPRRVALTFRRVCLYFCWFCAENCDPQSQIVQCYCYSIVQTQLFLRAITRTAQTSSYTVCRDMHLMMYRLSTP